MGCFCMNKKNYYWDIFCKLMDFIAHTERKVKCNFFCILTVYNHNTLKFKTVSLAHM